MSAKKTKVILLTGALVLFVLLFIAPKNAGKAGNSAAQAAGRSQANENATLDVYVSMAAKSIEPAEKQQFDKLIAEKAFDSVAILWNRRKRPDLAAYYTEEKAKRSGKAEDWFSAGTRYYYAVQFTQDKSEVPALYQSAMRSIKKGLTLDPADTDAKIMLASAYVEGSQDPMQGVSMLREIEKTDSNNVKLQLTFAFFSSKSGQLDKAVNRFKKVLQLDSSYIEAYLHLADAYEQLNDKGETIRMLEEYAKRTGDVTAKLEVKKYIQQLKETNNNN